MTCWSCSERLSAAALQRPQTASAGQEKTLIHLQCEVTSEQKMLPVHAEESTVQLDELRLRGRTVVHLSEGRWFDPHPAQPAESKTLTPKLHHHHYRKG